MNDYHCLTVVARFPSLSVLWLFRTYPVFQGSGPEFGILIIASSQPCHVPDRVCSWRLVDHSIYTLLISWRLQMVNNASKYVASSRGVAERRGSLISRFYVIGLIGWRLGTTGGVSSSPSSLTSLLLHFYIPHSSPLSGISGLTSRTVR